MGKAETTKLLEETRIRKGLCRKCGKNDIARERSKSRCGACLDKGLNSYHKESNRKKRQMSAYYNQLRTSSLCFLCRCEKETDRTENANCEQCALFLNHYKNVRMRLRMRIANDEQYKEALKVELRKLKLKYPTRRK
jgi:hypothetical protein